MGHRRTPRCTPGVEFSWRESGSLSLRKPPRGLLTCEDEGVPKTNALLQKNSRFVRQAEPLTHVLWTPKLGRINRLGRAGRACEHRLPSWACDTFEFHGGPLTLLGLRTVRGEIIPRNPGRPKQGSPMAARRRDDTGACWAHLTSCLCVRSRLNSLTPQRTCTPCKYCATPQKNVELPTRPVRSRRTK